MYKKWRVLPIVLMLTILAAGSLFGPGAQAQVLIPADTLPSDTEAQLALQRGSDLEAEQRWGEALSHYENAVRTFPEHKDLWQRLIGARAHYDLARRYEDSTYRKALKTLAEQDAINLYSEILSKIETHYVQRPDWHSLAERGIANLDIGLENADFRKANGIQASAETIRAYQEHIHRRMEVTDVTSREQAREVAINVAHVASQQLGLIPTAAIMEFTCGATCALDQYSSFLTGGQLADVFNQIEGNFVGLGIELRAKHVDLEIVSVIAGSPAEQAGVRTGERIIEVDGTRCVNVSTDEAADLLKGLEGSSSELVLQNPDGQTRRIRLVRRRIEVPSIEDVRIIDRELGTAYLKITSFQKTTSRDMDAALWKLHREGMKTLIIDVRGNPGGLLTAAVEVADKFVDSGNLVSTRGRNSHEDFDYRAHSLGTWRVPLLVLIDGDTASASEIFAGAIRDHRRGTVVGQRSYGKGSVQGIFTLTTTDVGVRLTTAKFFSPSGQAISNRGVSPDLLVHMTRKPEGQSTTSGTEPSEDATLQAAVQYVKNQTPNRQMARSR